MLFYLISYVFGGKKSRHLYKYEKYTDTMASLKLFLGPVASGKTVELIISAHQLQNITNPNHIKLLKPAIDTRFDSDLIKSASGLQIKITDRINPIQNLLNLDFADTKYIFVDEIQFFTVSQVEQLREISLIHNIDIFCFGLLNDYKCNLFDSTKRILEICDEYRQITSFCMLCKEHNNTTINKATHNLRIMKFENEILPIFDGESIIIGGLETFIPVCYSCREKEFSKIKK